jgi:hypothetical protein
VILTSEPLFLQAVGGALPCFLGGTQRLNNDYAGPILRVGRTVDSSKLDVTHIAELADFCGASGYVWGDLVYDQSGQSEPFDLRGNTQTNQIYTKNAGYLRSAGATEQDAPVIRTEILQQVTNRKLFTAATGLSFGWLGAIQHYDRDDGFPSQIAKWAPFELGVETAADRYVIGGYHDSTTYTRTRFVRTEAVGTYQSTLVRWPFASSFASGASWRQNGVELAQQSGQADTSFTSAEANRINTQVILSTQTGSTNGENVGRFDFSVLAVWPYRIAAGAQLTALDAWFAKRV